MSFVFVAIVCKRCTEKISVHICLPIEYIAIVHDSIPTTCTVNNNVNLVHQFANNKVLLARYNSCCFLYLLTCLRRKTPTLALLYLLHASLVPFQTNTKVTISVSSSTCQYLHENALNLCSAYTEY
jgi:hypothetical protein